MKKTTKRAKYRSDLCIHQADLTFDQLEDLCDDPKRDEPGGAEIRAILTYDEKTGFILSVQDADSRYSILQEDGQPVQYRTIEMAITELREIPYLCSDLRLAIDESVTSTH